MSETEVPFDGEVEVPSREEGPADAEETAEESEEPDIEAPEADFVEQHIEVDLDDDDYR
ncbi:hypothetical protein [Actinopolymorpha rutila]|uniref:Uncharacterized protein n=1 Tax=Actinopolymorpha rutila TaxID=446787 RepID=A0A852ZKL5_9ACTN|nr:hypothetical protein [Actinopolymorpha rutila]NYH88916.1 hypothetical protein [Actinopolymorpha rutila]